MPTILITAGEASGDRLGAALMEVLKRTRPNLTFVGVGGPEMEKQGLTSLFPMSDLAVMGLFEVIPAIPRILGRLKQLEDLAATAKPDLVLTIDSQDFSSRLAKRLKKRLAGTPHIHYVAPKVWAWRQSRVKKLKNLYTHLITILPFEEAFFATAGLPATYVGHPATTALSRYRHNSSTQNPTLALLPGSRESELTRHWPIFLQTARMLHRYVPNLSFVLALPNEEALATCQKLAPWMDADNIFAVMGEDRFKKLAYSTAALSKSGTNNLELALIGTPAVVAYRMNELTYQLAKRLVKVPFISLPNLILHYSGRTPVYPEHIQPDVTAEKLTARLLPLVLGQAPAQQQQEQLNSFHKLMMTPQPPAALAAAVVAKYL